MIKTILLWEAEIRREHQTSDAGSVLFLDLYDDYMSQFTL